jgi:hypothetical protein
MVSYQQKKARRAKLRDAQRRRIKDLIYRSTLVHAYDDIVRFRDILWTKEQLLDLCLHIPHIDENFIYEMTLGTRCETQKFIDKLNVMFMLAPPEGVIVDILLIYNNRNSIILYLIFLTFSWSFVNAYCLQFLYLFYSIIQVF